MNSSVVIQDKGIHLGTVNFFEKAQENPCARCSAPCCRMVVIPHPAPTTFMDLDYILYMLGFPAIQMLLSRDGSWQVAIETTCRFLDGKTHLCTVHDTPRKPKTCVTYNQYRCWYKPHFDKKNEMDDLVRFDLEGFEAFLMQIRFDEEGNITEIPTWEFTQELVKNSKLPHQVHSPLPDRVGPQKDGETASVENLDLPHRVTRQDVDAPRVELDTDLIPIADSVAD